MGVTGNFLQLAIPAASNNYRVNLQRVTSWLPCATRNERILQRAASSKSYERILQRITSDFTTSNDERVNLQRLMSNESKVSPPIIKESEKYFINIEKPGRTLLV